MRRLILALLVWLAQPAGASEIVGALSQNRVALTANFTGSEILIFGAIRHDQPGEADIAPYDVILVVEGPPHPVAIWRKARRFGIWVNVDVAYMASVPSFYAVATTAPLDQILLPEEDARLRISPAHVIRPEQATGARQSPQDYPQALLRLRTRSEAYQVLNRWVFLDRSILFRANIRLPANLTEGAYTTRMYLVRDGLVVSNFRTAIFVRKEGIERWLSQLAFDQPFLYGLLALAIALVAGWGASQVGRLFRHNID